VGFCVAERCILASHPNALNTAAKVKHNFSSVVFPQNVAEYGKGLAINSTVFFDFRVLLIWSTRASTSVASWLSGVRRFVWLRRPSLAAQTR
jgi:hypothetical protein